MHRVIKKIGPYSMTSYIHYWVFQNHRNPGRFIHKLDSFDWIFWWYVRALPSSRRILRKTRKCWGCLLSICDGWFQLWGNHYYCTYKFLFLKTKYNILFSCWNKCLLLLESIFIFRRLWNDVPFNFITIPSLRFSIPFKR